jgi:cAMP phosphodiesterase
MDSVAHDRDKPIVVHARPETIKALREHVFNWQIWPDFTAVPTPEQPFAILEEMTPGSTVELNGRHFRSVEAEHTVPAVGYLISGDNGSLIFSGDTTVNDKFWEVANNCEDLKYVVVETTFVDAERDLSELAKHLCPQLVASELAKLQVDADVYITHLMPGQDDAIMHEIAQHFGGKGPAALERGHVFSL